jgi:hypothetical protein
LERELTGTTLACLGKTEEDRSSRILPESAGDVEDEFVASVASRLNSLNRDDADDIVKLLDASAWRRVHCNSGAASTMATVVFGAIFLLGSLQRRKKGPGGEWRRRLGGKERN